MSVTNLMRAEILDLQGYETLVGASQTIKMNKNENPWQGVKVIKELQLNRYPDLQGEQLIECIRNYYHIFDQDILLTRGSDEGIDLIIRLFCRPYQDAVLIMPPTFGMYEIYAQINAVDVKKVALQGGCFSLAITKLAKNRDQNCKVVFICSPNNPTGNAVDVADIQQLCRIFNNAIIVVDEAYIDFSESESSLSLLNECANLIVLRTLSKSFGLAGVRCGMVFASKEIISYLKKIAAPYTLSTLSIYAATQCFKPAVLSQIQNRIERIKHQREQLYKSLSNNRLFSKVWPSEANFILVETTNAQDILRFCLANNIFLRNFKQDSGLKDCLRISVGSYPENRKLLSVLQAYSEMKP